MKRMLFPLILILSMLFSSFGTISPVQATNLSSATDLDQDGITNSMELNGWYNLSGGPYMTNPNLADSDHDGLTDAQEKLFNTNPLDAASPGIAVQYETSFQTLKYFSATDPAYLHMVQGGNRYLLTEAAVIRRGTTFKIAAVNSATASLTVTGAGMTAITATRDVARGGWLISIPLNGTSGTYTATLTNGAMTKSMPIYVIFELPAGLSKAQTDAYLYSDDPADNRDQVAVWWRAVDWQYYNNDSPTLDPNFCTGLTPGACSNWAYHTMSGYAQAFWTEQYTKKVLVDYSMPVIQGKSNALDAITAIGTKADQAVWVNFNGVKNSFTGATTYFYGEDPAHPGTFGYHMAGGACETQSGVYTSMLRSVGIASQPFALDYNKTDGHGENGSFGKFEYDHAVMMWVNNVWYAQRTFNGTEPIEYAPSPSWSNGPLQAPSLLSDWRTKFKFQDAYSDVVQAANEGWDFQVGSAGGGMVNTVWDGNASDVPGAEFVYQNRDFKWNSKSPLQIQQSPLLDILNCQLWQGDAWAPSEWRTPVVSSPAGRSAVRTYYLPANLPALADPLENWPYNPQPTSCSDSTSTEACNTFKLAYPATTCAALPGQTLASMQSIIPQAAPTSGPAVNTLITLGNITANSGLDRNGDGKFDQLTVQFDLSSTLAGKYQLGGWLKVGDKHIRAQTVQVTLVPGNQSLQVSFDGHLIGTQQANGPYQVDAIWVASADKAVSEMALPEEMLAYRTFTYSSQAYSASDFQGQAAAITGNYSYVGTDTNAKGLFDSISISVPLTVSKAGSYTVEGDLYDGNGEYIAHADWTGNSSQALLKYVVKGSVPPYSLKHLNLSDDQGMVLSSYYASVYTISDLSGKVDLGNVAFVNQSTGMSPQAIAPSNIFTITPVDSNANGRYDQLTVSTTVNVTVQSASYWMEGLLIDAQNIPVAWGVGTPLALGIGDNQTLQMSFDAKQLFDHLPLVGSQSFRLIAVKIFSGSPVSAVLEGALPITGVSTPLYQRSNLEPSESGITVFQDDLESGAAKWNTAGSSQWSQTSSMWHSLSHAWIANGSASTSGLLSLAAPLDLSGYVAPLLKFNTAYQLSSGQSVKLEVSTNGSLWTTLKTYTGLTDYWLTESVDLSSYAKTAGVQLRFNAQSNAGSVWAIDDMFINAKPAVTSASFTYSPAAKVGVETTFTANYVSVDKTFPVTYQWNFCGTLQQVSTPAIVHMFTQAGNCQVQLTVINPFDSASALPQTLVVKPGIISIFLPALSR